MSAASRGAPRLVEPFAQRPLLTCDRVVMLGRGVTAWTPWERQQAGRLGLDCIDGGALTDAPEAAAGRALAALAGRCERFVVHFDVDVLDLIDATHAEDTHGRDNGSTLEQATHALAARERDGGCRPERDGGLT